MVVLWGLYGATKDLGVPLTLAMRCLRKRQGPPNSSASPDCSITWQRGGVSGWPKRSKLPHACRWGYCNGGLKLAQLLGQLGVSLTCRPPHATSNPAHTTRLAPHRPLHSAFG